MRFCSLKPFKCFMAVYNPPPSHSSLVWRKESSKHISQALLLVWSSLCTKWEKSHIFAINLHQKKLICSQLHGLYCGNNNEMDCKLLSFISIQKLLFLHQSNPLKVCQRMINLLTLFQSFDSLELITSLLTKQIFRPWIEPASLASSCTCITIMDNIHDNNSG